MDVKTAKILCEITSDFYRSHHDSFSRTRTSPWNGWRQCLDVLAEAGFANEQKLSVFDLACGNLRFASFLKDALPDVNLTYHAIDNCDQMVPEFPWVQYQSLDILDEMPQDACSIHELGIPLCDLSVSFGFMHHVPLWSQRKEVLRALVNQTRSGGFVIISFWQFLNNADMAEKAQATHERALQELGLSELETNDFLLGWRNEPNAYRYCHSFTDPEIDQLIEMISDKATVLSRFVSDGRTDNLNTYVILQVKQF